MAQSTCVPWRYVVVVTTFLAVLSVTAMRYCFSLTLTQMVTSPAALPFDEVAAFDSLSCPIGTDDPALSANASSDYVEADAGEKKYDWSQELQGMILASFYLGYAIGHFPGGLLADWIGGKSVIVTAQICTVLITMTIPTVVAAGGAYGLIVVRLTMGLMQGGIFPAINTILSAWVPPSERGRMASLVFCGYPLGSAAGTFFSGIILHHHPDWQIVFYYFSIVGAIATVLFVTLCTSNPNSHPFVSEDEKDFLRKELGSLKRDKNLPATPWKSILKSRPMTALILCSFLGDWTYYVLLVDLPKYMNDVIHVSLEDNGLYSSIPWSMFVAVSLISSYCCDWLISSGCLGVTRTRKLFVIVSSVFDGFFVMAAAYGGCNALVVGIFFAISVGATGLQTSSLYVNAMDLSPNYSGAICGFTSTFGALAGTLGPALVGFLTPNSLQSEWRLVFWINFGMHVLKMSMFTAWGSAEVQPWNEPERAAKPKRSTDDGESSEAQLPGE